MNIDLTPILVAAIGGVFSVLGIIATVMMTKYTATMKDENMRRQLLETLQNSLGRLQIATEAEVRDAHIQIPGVPIQLAPAVQYVLDHAPEAIEHFGITPEAVADKVLARIGVQNIETNKAIAASPTDLIPHPLASLPADPTPPAPPSGEVLGGATRNIR